MMLNGDVQNEVFLHMTIITIVLWLQFFLDELLFSNEQDCKMHFLVTRSVYPSLPFCDHNVFTLILVGLARVRILKMFTSRPNADISCLHLHANLPTMVTILILLVCIIGACCLFRCCN
jgi:hypothetical protein